MTQDAAHRPGWIVPRLGDPRITIAVALSAYTILGQTVLYFNRDVRQIAAAVLGACVADMLLAFMTRRIPDSNTRLRLESLQCPIATSQNQTGILGHDLRYFTRLGQYGDASREVEPRPHANS